jgi:hypothetical protein
MIKFKKSTCVFTQKTKETIMFTLKALLAVLATVGSLFFLMMRTSVDMPQTPGAHQHPNITIGQLMQSLRR